MGKMNMKLMQGISEAEELLGNHKQTKSIQAEIPTKGTREFEAAEGSPSDSSTKVPAPTKPTKGKKEAKNKKTNAANGQKIVFSFRIHLSDISIWKSYAVATGTSMEKIASQAMTEFVNRHKLSGPELAVFEALMAREKQQE